MLISISGPWAGDKTLNFGGYEVKGQGQSQGQGNYGAEVRFGGLSNFGANYRAIVQSVYVITWLTRWSRGRSHDCLGLLMLRSIAMATSSCLRVVLSDARDASR